MLAAWRGFGICVCAVPFLFFIDYPSSWIFWLHTFLQGIMTGIFSSRVYNAAALFGAGATSRILVLSIIVSAILWWCLNPANFIELAQKPALLIGIIASMILAIFGYYRMSDHSRSEGIFRYMIVAVFIDAIISINRKNLMAEDGFLTGNTAYFLVSMFVAGLYNACAYLYINKCKISDFFKIALETRSIRSGSIIALLSAFSIFFGNYALSLASNPAYVNALTLTSPLWILVYNKFTGFQNNFRKSGLAIMLIFTAILIFLGEFT